MISDGVVLSDPFALISEWWGEELTKELSVKILEAPQEHLRQFLQAVRTAEGESIEKLGKRRVRPIVKHSSIEYFKGNDTHKYWDSVLPLLLYTDEVAVENPLSMCQDPSYKLAEIMDFLLQVKPLAAKGIVKFIKYPVKYNHPSRTHIKVSKEKIIRENPSLIEVLSEMRELDEKNTFETYSSAIFCAEGALGLSINLASESVDRLSILASTEEEAVFLPMAVCARMSRISGIRDLRLGRLANLKVPRISGPGVAAVRQSSEEFNEWRGAFDRALTEIEKLAPSQVWEKDASLIFRDELFPIKERLEKVCRQSPALSALSSGVARFSYSGLGVVAIASAGGSPLLGALGAGVANTAQVAVDYLRALREAGKNREILGMALTFFEEI